jgi:hypothetical protein
MLAKLTGIHCGISPLEGGMAPELMGGSRRMKDRVA